MRWRLKEKAPRFRKTKTVESIMAIDSDFDDAPLEAARQADDQPPQFAGTRDDTANRDFAAIELDVDEAAFIGEQPSAAERREIVCDGRAPFAGCRSNDFCGQLRSEPHNERT